MSTNSPRFYRNYVQPQTALRTIPNASGVWTNTGAKWVRTPEGMKVDPVIPTNPIPYMTGTASPAPGNQGRRKATFSFPGVPVIPSGAAGSPPDADPFYQCAFGPPAVSAGVSVSYAPSDTSLIPLIIARFNHVVPHLSELFGWGAIVKSIDWTFNGNYLLHSLSGDMGYALDYDNFSTEDAIGKAGLTAWPAEPSATVLGTPLSGFIGTATFDSQTFAGQIKSMALKYDTGKNLVEDCYGDGYPSQIIQGPRQVSGTLSFLDNSSAALIDLKQKGKFATPITLVIAAGNVAGATVTFTMTNVQLTPFNLTDSTDQVLTDFTFTGNASSLGSTDDLVMLFS